MQTVTGAKINAVHQQHLFSSYSQAFHGQCALAAACDLQHIFFFYIISKYACMTTHTDTQAHRQK